MVSDQVFGNHLSSIAQDVPTISYGDILLPADALRRSTRKRAHVTYTREYSFNDTTSSEEDEEIVPNSKRVKAVKNTKPLPKRKIFPFMMLPAELRNKIYEMALIGTGAIYVTSKTKSYRRIAKRCIDSECRPQYNSSSRYGHYWNPNPVQEEPEESAHRLNVFSPNLLAVSKTIYSEAASLLYSQPFLIADNYALLNFINQIGLRHATMLRDLTIKSWCDSRSHKSVNFPAMAMLSHATNLERLNIACSVGYFRHYGWRNGRSVETALKVARKIYRDCYPWLESVGRAKGNIEAGIAVLDLSDTNFETSQRGNNEIRNEADVDAQMERFRGELRRLLINS